VVYTGAGKSAQALNAVGQTAGPAFAIDDFVASLVSLGYQKAEARQLIECHSDTYDGNDEKFLTFLLTQGITT